MKSLFKVSFFILLVAVWVGCEGDYRQKARGSFSEVVVVMDSTDLQSETAEALRATFGGWQQTLPGKPPRFDLQFRDFDSNQELDQLKRYRNLIVAAPITDSTDVARWLKALMSDDIEERVRQGESFAFPIQNEWYRDQWTLLLSAPSDSALAAQIRNSQETLIDNLLEKEFERWEEEIYDSGEQYALEDSLWQNHGWKIRVQHDWEKNIDTTYQEKGDSAHFLTMRRPLPKNDRWFWAWWKEVENIDHVDSEWINAKRDSLMEQWIRGTRDSSYVTTAYDRPLETDRLEINNDTAFETLGIWTMTNDAMAGPFANMTIYDEESGRLFMLEFAQFAPKYGKRRFVRQFRTMLRTFKSDSTWQGNQTIAEK